MSDVPLDDCGSEISDTSPEVPLSSSRREQSKVSRKKLNFEDFLDSHSDEDDRSKGHESKTGAGRPLKTSVSESSRLNTIARGYTGGGGTPRTSSQHTDGPFVLAAHLSVPSKTPPALRRHSVTTTPYTHSRPLTSLSNPEKGKGTTRTISSKEVSMHSRKTPESRHLSSADSRKRPVESPPSEKSSSPSEPPPKKSSIESQLTEILQEVKKTYTRLDTYDEKLESLQERLLKLEEKPASSSVSSSDASVSKRKVPPEVRQLVRDVYKTLLDDAEADFDGFDVKKRYTDPVNQAVVKKVLAETRSLDPTVCAMNVQDATRRFFQSKLEEKSLKDNGRYEAKVQKQRRKNRLTKKLNDRKAILESISDEGRKATYKEVVVMSFMSSEESGEEVDENGDPKPVLYVHSLPWRSSKVNKLFSVLDSQIEKKKSKRALSQTYARFEGNVSERPKPSDLPVSFWGFAI